MATKKRSSKRTNPLAQLVQVVNEEEVKKMDPKVACDQYMLLLKHYLSHHAHVELIGDGEILFGGRTNVYLESPFLITKPPAFFGPIIFLRGSSEDQSLRWGICFDELQLENFRELTGPIIHAFTVVEFRQFHNSSLRSIKIRALEDALFLSVRYCQARFASSLINDESFRMQQSATEFANRALVIAGAN